MSKPTEKQIAGNIAIAEFLGFEKNVDYYKMNHKNLNSNYFLHFTELKFHKDIAWLKTVIDEFATLQFGYEPLSGVSLYSSTEEIWNVIVDEIVKNKLNQNP